MQKCGEKNEVGEKDEKKINKKNNSLICRIDFFNMFILSKLWSVHASVFVSYVEFLELKYGWIIVVLLT